MPGGETGNGDSEREPRTGQLPTDSAPQGVGQSSLCPGKGGGAQLPCVPGSGWGTAVLSLALDSTCRERSLCGRLGCNHVLYSLAI